MILRADEPVGNILVAAVHLPEAATGPWLRPWLNGIDWSISIAAVVVAILLVAIHIVFRRGDPLAEAPARTNRIREDAVLIAMGVYLAAASVLSMIPGASADAQDPAATARAMILGSTAQLVGAIACLCVARTRVDGGVVSFVFGRETGDLKFRVRVAIGGLIGLLALGLCPWITELTVALTTAIIPHYEFPPHPTLDALKGGQPALTTAALWVGAGVIAPVAEELFFRGLLQSWLAGLLRSQWTAILVSSILFGLTHAGQPHAVPALTCFAVLLGYAYARTGGLVVPIFIHALFNVKTLVWTTVGGFS